MSLFKEAHSLETQIETCHTTEGLKELGEAVTQLEKRYEMTEGYFYLNRLITERKDKILNHKIIYSEVVEI